MQKEHTENISINTPTKGVTACDLVFFFIYAISINTPTKGVTLSVKSFSDLFNDFNQHSHEGSDC